DNGQTVFALANFIRNFASFILPLIERASDETLGRKHRLQRVGNSLTAGSGTDENIAVLAESDDGRSCAGTFGVSDDNRLISFHNRDDGVRRSKVDSNY